jgi:YHS domain-containing protein
MNRFVCTLSVVSMLVAAPAFAADKPDEQAAKKGPGGKVDFATQIQPILKETCYDCHGVKKHKGDLRLDSPEAIMKGGENGKVIVPGKSGESKLYKVITLPKDSDDIMPPKGDPLNKQQTDLIKAWIDQGASFGAAGSGGASGGDKPAKKAVEVPAADAKALSKLQSLGALAMPLARDTNLITVDFRAEAEKIGDSQLGELKLVAQQVAWLNLAKTKVTDEGLAQIAAFPNLTRLHLENTGITDAGLKHLASLKNLEYLNLYGTKVTDAGLAQLKGNTNLQKVFVWQTPVTANGAKALQDAVKGLTVDRGWDPASLPKPAPAPAPAAAAAAGKTPINKVCPVSGKDVDPTKTFAFQGQTIGFCCGDCCKKFAKNPTEFIGKVKEFKPAPAAAPAKPEAKPAKKEKAA